jgi:hypothetical protein
MRLNKNAKFRATCELLSILAEHSEGMTTTELSGTPQFHGEWTLRNRQIIRLLRATEEVRERTVGYGRRTATLWKLKELSEMLSPTSRKSQRPIDGGRYETN